MENRSHALMAGIFTLVLLAAAAGGHLDRTDRTQLQPYEIVSATAVSGLNSQSTVRYQGVPVGKVQSLALNPDKPGQVRIRIGVAPSTPITESTWAELGVQGVTGLANVELRDDGSSLKRLTRGAGLRFRCDRAFRTARAARRQADLERRGSDQPTQAGAERAERAGAGHGAAQRRRADRVAQERQPRAAAGHGQDRAAGRFAGRRLAPGWPRAREVGDLAQQARQSLARLNAPDGPLATATRSLSDIASAAARLDGETLPAITGMAQNIGQAARGATHPAPCGQHAAILAVRPRAGGPGEAGFAGFGSTSK